MTQITRLLFLTLYGVVYFVAYPNNTLPLLYMLLSLYDPGLSYPIH